MRIKLFENFKESELAHSVRVSFQDLIEDDILDMTLDEESQCIYLCTSFESEMRTTSFDDFYSSKKKEMNTLELLGKCINRLREFHEKEIIVDFEVESFNDAETEIAFTIREGVAKKGDFWKFDAHGMIKLNYSKLKSMLDIPKDVDITHSSSGKHDYISFRFRNKEEVERYKDNLISKFTSLMIEDKPVVADVSWSYSSSTGEEMAKYKVKIDNQRSYRGTYGQGKETINSVDFGLNSEFEWNW